MWRQRSGSKLAQVLVSCLTTQSYYLNQCWLITRKVQWHSPDDEFTRDTRSINDNFYLSEISFKFPRVQWVNLWCVRNRRKCNGLVLFLLEFVICCKISILGLNVCDWLLPQKQCWKALTNASFNLNISIFCSRLRSIGNFVYNHTVAINHFILNDKSLWLHVAPFTNMV